MTTLNSVSRTNIQVEFPLSNSYPEVAIRGAIEVLQTSSGHDVATIRYLGKVENLNLRYRTGAPVKITWSNRYGSSKFIGYVHHLRPVFENDVMKVDLVCIGSSFSLLEINQRSWQDVTADSIAKQIGEEKEFQVITEYHPRLYSQVIQNGISSWALLQRLSKETGYILNCDETTLIFLSRERYNSYYKPMAQTFTYVSGGPSAHRSSDIFMFKPVVGDYTPEIGTANLNRSVTTFDPVTGESYQFSGNLDTYAAKRTLFSAPSLKIAQTPGEAQAILSGRLEENRFVYKATALVVGSPFASPEKLVYLNNVLHPYGGYWTVTKVRHLIKSPTQYLMELDLGSDSLLGVSEQPPNSELSSEVRTSPTFQVIPQDLSNPLSVRRAESELVDFQNIYGFTSNALEYARWKAKEY